MVLKNFKTKNNYGNDSLIMNNKTLISDSIVKEEEFKRIDIPDTLDINSLNKVAPEQLVSFKAKVVNISGTKQFRTQKGHFIKQEAFLIDPTGSIKVILWRDYVGQLQEAATYAFSGLRLKQVDGEKYVNTPRGDYFKSEVVSPFEDTLPQVENVSQMKNVGMTVDVIGVTTLTKSHCCRACGRKLQIQSDKSSYGNCSNCNMRQKISASTANWYTKVFLHDCSNPSTKLSLSANTFVLMKVTQLAHLDFHTATEDDMTESLLDITALQLTYDPITKKIVGIAPTVNDDTSESQSNSLAE